MSIQMTITIFVRVLDGNKNFIGRENDMRNAKKD